MKKLASYRFLMFSKLTSGFTMVWPLTGLPRVLFLPMIRGTSVFKLPLIYGCESMSEVLTITSVIERNSLADVLFVFQNPSTGQVNIQGWSMLNGGRLTVKIFDARGKNSFTETLQVNGQFSESLDLGHLPKGLLYASTYPRKSLSFVALDPSINVKIFKRIPEKSRFGRFYAFLSLNLV